MKLRRKFFAAVSSLAVAVTVLLAGCGAPAQEGTALKETGTLTLSVNPEIQIEYNGDGKDVYKRQFQYGVMIVCKDIGWLIG